MVERRRWRWLHRIGYVCTALISIEFIFVASAFGVRWWSNRQHAQFATRTYAGPLSARENPGWREVAPLLKALPPLHRIAPEGLRVGISTVWGNWSYAFAFKLPPGAERGDGWVVAKGQRDCEGQNVRRHFTFSAAGYRELVSRVDGRIEQLPSIGGFWTDLWEVGFERIIDGKVISGQNGGVREPVYPAIGRTVLGAVDRLLPASARLDAQRASAGCS